MSQQRCGCTAALIVALVVVPVSGWAERLPIRTFTTVDGLAHDRIFSIVADSRGFLWFCTANGLSRFDGSRFITFTEADGLPPASITSIVEQADGSYWIGSNGGGVAWYRPLDGRTPAVAADSPSAAAAGAASSARRPSRFTTVDVAMDPRAANRVNVLFRDRADGLWAGTDAGLFRLRVSPGGPSFERVSLRLGRDEERRVQVWAMAEDRDRTLWIGTSHGLVGRSAAGKTVHYTLDPVGGRDHVWTLLVDEDGGLWGGHEKGLFRLGPVPFLATPGGASRSLPLSRVGPTVDDAGPRRRTVEWLTTGSGLADGTARALHRSRTGSIWIGTDGLSRLEGGRALVSYGPAQGVPKDRISAIAEDRDGNVWVGTESRGAMRLAAHGMTSYAEAEGLEQPLVLRLFEDHHGRLCAVGPGPVLQIFDGQRFRAVRPNIGTQESPAGRARAAYLIQDRQGDWWIPSGAGLYRFSGVARTRDLERATPIARYTKENGLAGNDIWRLFEDSRGDVWISTRVSVRVPLTRWERATGRFYRYSDRDGLPANNPAIAFAEDRAGQLWVGFWDGGLARRRGGRFEYFSSSDGLPDGTILTLLVDREGRLWIGSRLGLALIDNPTAADRLRISRLTTADGLPSNLISVGAQDRFGRLYLGTAKGVTRFDARSGALKHYTVAEGLAGSETVTAFVDRTGAVWFATWRGVSRLTIEPDDPMAAGPALITAVRINGVPRHIADMGARALGAFRLGAGHHHVEIEFFALDYTQPPRLQYRLEGAEEEWTDAGDRRTATFAQLSQGSYRFLVRTLTAEGRPTAPASVGFTIPPPLWQRWWFMALVGITLALVAFVAHRARVARLLEVERIRTRIASDLHDDIGSNLSQIAILSEVLQHGGEGSGGSGPSSSAPLARIADLSRESVDAMSDIVWAIDPRRDHLTTLTARMRRVAVDLLSPRGIRFDFDVEGEPDRSIGPEARRELFLIFKEALHNAVRHAECATVHVRLRVDSGRLDLRVRDDGCGFDAARADGHGLANLQRRASRLGGTLTVTTGPAGGTTIDAAVPLRPAPSPRLNLSE